MFTTGEPVPGQGGTESVRNELHPEEARLEASKIGRELTRAFLDKGLIQRIPTTYIRGYDKSKGYRDKFVVPDQVKQAIKEKPVRWPFHNITGLQVYADNLGTGQSLEVRVKDKVTDTEETLIFSLDGRGRVGSHKAFTYHDHIAGRFPRYDYDDQVPYKPGSLISREAANWFEIEPHAQRLLDRVSSLGSKFAPTRMETLKAAAKRVAMRATVR